MFKEYPKESYYENDYKTTPEHDEFSEVMLGMFWIFNLFQIGILLIARMQ